VHLDPDRRAALFSALAGLPAQVFLTGSDREIFAPLRDVAAGFRSGGETLTIDPDFTPI